MIRLLIALVCLSAILVGLLLALERLQGFTITIAKVQPQPESYHGRQ